MNITKSCVSPLDIFCQWNRCTVGLKSDTCLCFKKKKLLKKIGLCWFNSVLWVIIILNCEAQSDHFGKVVLYTSIHLAASISSYVFNKHQWHPVVFQVFWCCWAGRCNPSSNNKPVCWLFGHSWCFCQLSESFILVLVTHWHLIGPYLKNYN